MSITFVSGGEKFTFETDKLPEGCLLNDIMTQFHPKDGMYEVDYKPSDLGVVYDYLMVGRLPNYEDLKILDFFGISEFHSYKLATLRENYMRENMYKPEFENHDMNTDIYYNLQKITKKFWNNLDVGTSKVSEKSMLFDSVNLIKNNWGTGETEAPNISETLKTNEGIDKKLEELKELLNALNEGPGKCFIAGGKIFNTLFKLCAVFRFAHKGILI